MNEVLNSILEWYTKHQAPNSERKYHRCPICNASWWDHEQHNFDCWIPGLQNASKNHYMRIVDGGKAKPHFVVEELEDAS